jgi:hypothetical protein
VCQETCLSCSIEGSLLGARPDRGELNNLMARFGRHGISIDAGALLFMQTRAEGSMTLLRSTVVEGESCECQTERCAHVVPASPVRNGTHTSVIAGQKSPLYHTCPGEGHAELMHQFNAIRATYAACWLPTQDKRLIVRPCRNALIRHQILTGRPR